MFRIGAHVSIGGGYPEAVDRIKDIGGNCAQIFSGSPRGWKVTSPDDNEIEAFKRSINESDIKPWIVHSTYLINLATPKEGLAKKSVEALQKELDVTSMLGIPYYTFHPGAHTGAGVDQGIKNIADRVSELEIPDNVTLLLENTAGKGTTLGRTFEELNRIVDLSDYGYGDVGVCLDTCHLYAKGYDFTTKDKLGEMLDDFERTVGLDNLHFIHMNDSKHPLGSEKDEHEHIGEGEIGDRGFELILNHDILGDKPMVVETPVDKKGFEWNIEKCRKLRS